MISRPRMSSCPHVVPASSSRSTSLPPPAALPEAVPPGHPSGATLNFLSAHARLATRTHRAGVVREETRPRQALGRGRRHVVVSRDDRHAFLPQLLEVLGDLWRGCIPDTCGGGPAAHRQHPRRLGRAGVLVPPVGRQRQHRHLLHPQRRLPRELAPLLLPRAWGKRPRRRREPLPPAAPEPFAWQVGRRAGCSPRRVERLTWTPAPKIYP